MVLYTCFSKKEQIKLHAGTSCSIKRFENRDKTLSGSFTYFYLRTSHQDYIYNQMAIHTSVPRQNALEKEQ